MKEIVHYVKPELLVVAIVLYFIGGELKKSETIKDKYIPLILGVIGIAFSSVWVIATLPLKNLQDIAMAVFVAGVQGILVAEIGRASCRERV